MRKRLFPVACAALALAALFSCATVASRPPVLTVELFDSRSATDPAGAKGIASLVLPVPPVPLSSPTTAEGPAVIVGPADIVGLAAPRVPANPSPRATLALRAPLALPVVPSLSQAPRPAPARATPAPVAPPKTAGATRQPAAPAAPPPAASTAVTPSPAAPAAGSSTSAASSTATAPVPGADAYGRLREIYARVGDAMQIGLDGGGFLFLGFPDKQAQADGMSFKTKEIREGKTWFTFQALKLGTYDLDFLQQDNVSGRSSRETVRVHVVNDQDFSAAVAQPQATQGTAAEAGDPGFADKLSGLGAYEAAVVELLKGYRDGNASLNDRIAGLYMRMGSYEAAGKYYQKNLSLPGAFADTAVMGLVRVAAVTNDQAALMEQLKRFLAVQGPGVEEPLILAVRMERDQGQIGLGLDLAAEYASRFPQGRWRDEAEFIAAQFLEADSQFRDIARARDLYRDVVSRYPLGDFAAAALARLQYIERHFYQVR